MTTRRVIFPDPDFWTRRPTGTPRSVLMAAPPGAAARSLPNVFPQPDLPERNPRMTPKPFVTNDNQLDALALIEAVANGDEAAEKAMLRAYFDGDVGGLVAGLVVIAMTMANVGVEQGAWATAPDALALTRLGILDVTAEEGK